MPKEAEKFAPSGILEGMVSLRALIAARDAGINDRPIEKILYAPDKAAAKRKELGWLRAIAPRHGFVLEEAAPGEIDSLTVGNTHGGIIALCGQRTFPALTDDFIRPDGFYVLLEGVEDPYNFGYSLRSLYAAGVDGVILSPRNWMSAAGVVCRASAGASERFPMAIAEDGPAAAGIFRRKGYRIVCADLENSVSALDADLQLPLFLVVGGEKRGITRALLDSADAIVRLDYGREFPAALSTASASTILAFEVFRQNREKFPRKD